jgi:hypothetical protein
MVVVALPSTGLLKSNIPSDFLHRITLIRPQAAKVGVVKNS